ncbi:MAG: 16S rRNA (guanine(527)-N(7))-methyltransferase RsmG [Oscillospiraceae bacterium]|jgi:16S rRNA (guanine527-N7)-methyltransferase|nr:16S rRNA (guanine(527)-N(7))-methyltransferase RsmG [Oscillospiraceae bacterium]
MSDGYLTVESAMTDGLRALGLDGVDIAAFRVYYDALVFENEHQNLTTITAEPEVASLHFLDSLAILPHIDRNPRPQLSTVNCQLSIVDIGSGAGFPGLPIAIARPDYAVTMLDAREKRVDFLRDTIKQLGITNATATHGRAEEYAAAARESFDIAVSRAVANLRELAELCLPLVKIGGTFLAMKSRGSDAEIAASSNAIATLGGAPAEIVDYTLPDGTPRRIVVVRKIAATPPQYPRRYKKIETQPL